VTRIQTPDLLPEEDELDRSLRPRSLADFVGQEPLKDQLAVSLEAAAARGEALDHVLLAGPPGLGKTSLAQILAEELGVPFVATAAPALERKGDIAALLTALEPRSVFFVDEIHRLSRALEETFYPAMEDRRLPITVGQGAGAKVVTLELPPFTLVGRHDARGPAHDAPARPLRHPAPPGALRAPGPRRDRPPVGRHPRRAARRRGRRGDRRPLARDPARGQPAAQARARLRPGARGRRGDRGRGARRARPPAGRPPRAWTGWTARSSPRSA
jgi:hypothetical protein